MRHEREYSIETARDSLETVGRSPPSRRKQERRESFVLQAGATSYSAFHADPRAQLGSGGTRQRANFAPTSGEPLLDTP